MKLIQQLRNEAHRFGITFHRDLRSKGTFVTHLTDLSGIGKGTATKLLSHFRSVKKVKEATLEQLAEVVGQSRAALIKQAIDDAAILVPNWDLNSLVDNSTVCNNLSKNPFTKPSHEKRERKLPNILLVSRFHPSRPIPANMIKQLFKKNSTKKGSRSSPIFS